MTEPKPSTGACEHVIGTIKPKSPIYGTQEYLGCRKCLQPITNFEWPPKPVAPLMAPNTADKPSEEKITIKTKVPKDYVIPMDFEEPLIEKTVKPAEIRRLEERLTQIMWELVHNGDFETRSNAKVSIADYLPKIIEAFQPQIAALESQLHDRDATIKCQVDSINNIKNNEHWWFVENEKLQAALKEKDSRIALLNQEPSYQQGYKDCWENAVKPRNKELKGLEKELAEAKELIKELKLEKAKTEDNFEITYECDQAEIKVLKKNLKMYGAHNYKCAEVISYELSKPIAEKCDCGFEEALAQGDK